MKSIAVGDVVTAKPGKEHMPEHTGESMTVTQVVGTGENTFVAVRVMGAVHRWYRITELDSKAKARKSEEQEEISILQEIVAKREEDQYLLAPVLIADIEDRQTDIYSGREVEKAAWSFARNGWQPDHMHKELLGPDEALVVESWVYRPEVMGSPLVIGKSEFTTTTWFMGLIVGTRLWKKCQKGELTGLSITGLAQRREEEHA